MSDLDEIRPEDLDWDAAEARDMSERVLSEALTACPLCDKNPCECAHPAWFLRLVALAERQKRSRDLMRDEDIANYWKQQDV